MLDRKSLRGIGIFCALVVSGSRIHALAQVTGAFAPRTAGNFSQSAQLLPPEQLDNLVAPIALYPDQLLSEVLAASTYPLELVSAQQWLQRVGNLQGVRLMDAARQQNWDPSVQALVAFPDVLALLTRDVQWTTALGNAFLAQQADVMNAIQRMRARAQSNGRLQSGPQQIVQTQYQDGQNAIEIQPANPGMMYVPSYNPQYVWGPPAVGDYPQLGYPALGQIFGTVVNLASYFLGLGSLLGGGLGLLGGPWGWALNWFTHSILLNGLFFSHFGFHGGGYGGGFYGGGYGARSAWVHDPGHRMGVPYSNAAVASRFGGTFRPMYAGFGNHEAFGSREGFGSRAGFVSAGPASGGAFASRGDGWRTMGGATMGGGARGFSSSFNREGGGESGWHSAASNRGFGGSRLASNFGSGFGPRWGSEGNRGFSSPGFGSPARSSFAAPERSTPPGAFGERALTQHFLQRSSSQPHFSEPRVSAQHFSAPKAPHFSAPKASHSGGGHGSGGHGGGGHSHGGSHKH